MTRDEIVGKIIQNLEDEGMVHFTTDDLYDSIHDGYQIVALFTQCIEKITTISLVANQSYYNLRTLITDYYRVFAIYNQNTKRWLEPKAYKEFQEYAVNWELLHGNPVEWAPLGCDHLAIFRKPASAIADAFIIFYKAFPITPLAGNEEPEFFPEFHKILVEYVTSDLLDQDLEYTKANKWFTMFIQSLIALKKKVESRNFPDRIMTLVCQYSQTLTSIR